MYPQLVSRDTRSTCRCCDGQNQAVRCHHRGSIGRIQVGASLPHESHCQADQSPRNPPPLLCLLAASPGSAPLPQGRQVPISASAAAPAGAGCGPCFEIKEEFRGPAAAARVRGCWPGAWPWPGARGTSDQNPAASRQAPSHGHAAAIASTLGLAGFLCHARFGLPLIGVGGPEKKRRCSSQQGCA